MSQSKYLLPVNRKNLLSEESNVVLGFNSHAGSLCYALDFLVPEGSEIYAAQDGVVVYVKQDSNIGGPDKKYWADGNRIVIKHIDGEYSAYEHLRFMGAVVNVGQEVIPGELIGYSGNTGCSSCPHLHFEVFINPSEDESEGETVKIDWAGGHDFPYDQNVSISSFSQSKPQKQKECGHCVNYRVGYEESQAMLHITCSKCGRVLRNGSGEKRTI